MVYTSQNHGIVINAQNIKQISPATLTRGWFWSLSGADLSVDILFLPEHFYKSLSCHHLVRRQVLFTLEKPASFTFPAAAPPPQANYPV